MSAVVMASLPLAHFCETRRARASLLIFRRTCWITRRRSRERCRWTWASFMRMAANPKIPTLEEATAQALTEDESARFRAHMRPLVETHAGIYRSAVAYLSARK